MTVDDVMEQFSTERLVRTEISTLIGLACKKQLNTDIPSPEHLQEYIDRTESMLKEIHESMLPSISDILGSSVDGQADFNPCSNGTVLREAIFYGGEAAYNFQYRDLSAIKYRKDNDWLLEHKGFSIDHALAVATSIQYFQNEKATEAILRFRKTPPSKWNFLDAFTFTIEDVCERSGLKFDIFRKVVESFVAPIGMDGFESLDDFNPKNAYPIIKLSENNYLLFQNYNLMEALYETPFFWINDNRGYQSIGMQHRGEFAEEFSAERLTLVFGERRVFLNVNICDSKKNIVGEIDVLVVFANRAIVLQAKSKKLTILARKGNDNSLQDDFKKAVQSAYDQAYLCGTLLSDKNYSLIDGAGIELKVNRDFKEIYPFCIVSDHYPALSFQARQFLKIQESEIIKAPFVMDVFFLDVVTEMLNSPLHFLSYVNRRITYGERILSTHELTILSYHLKQNLWVDDKYTMMHLADDISSDLDLAMMTRREGAPGIETPEGILTKYKGSLFDQIIHDIEQLENPAIVDLGFMLLTLSGDTIEVFNDGVSQLIEMGKSDGRNHDLTLGLKDGETGLTIHCNDDPQSISIPRLEQHCKKRKYSQKARSWYGICIGQVDSRVRFGINADYEWVQSNTMDEIVRNLPLPQFQKGKAKINFKTITRKSIKTGRNEKCPCGSGKKYKRCCLKKPPL